MKTHENIAGNESDDPDERSRLTLRDRLARLRRPSRHAADMPTSTAGAARTHQSGRGPLSPDHDAHEQTTTEQTVPAPPHEARAASRNSLIEGPIAPTLWRLAVPLAFGFVINAVYSWINMYFVSGLGDEAIAAIGFCDQINLVIFTVGSGFGIGTGIIVARRVGERRFKEASFIATQAFSFMAVYATLAAVVLHFLIPYAFELLQLKGAVLQNATLYMTTLIFGFPAILLVFQANASIRSTGNTVFPMTVAITSAVINAVLDPLLIYGLAGMPRLGLQGAAIATATAQWVSALIATYALYSGRLNFRLYRPTVRFQWDIIGSIFRLGIPASLQTLAVSVSRVVVISLANMFGTAAVAAYTIGLRVDVLVMMPIFATGIAIETLVSQNLGARRFDRVQQFRSTAIRQLCGVIAAMGVAIYFLAGPIAGLFTSDAGVTALTVRYLHIAVFGYLFFVVGHTATRALSGAGHPLRALAITCIVLFAVQIPLVYGFAQWSDMSAVGVFIGITASMLVFALAGTYAVRGKAWMMKTV